MSDSTPPEESVTLVIPQFLQNSLSCFQGTREEDISHIYRITLKTPENQTLYVNNEQDLRDTLKQYCLYKQLCEKVDEEMKKMNLEFQLSDNSVRLVKSKHSKSANEFVRPKFNFTPTNNFGCEPECGRTSKVSFPDTEPKVLMAPPPSPEVVPEPPPATGGCDADCQKEMKKKCCTIL